MDIEAIEKAFALQLKLNRSYSIKSSWKIALPIKCPTCHAKQNIKCVRVRSNRGQTTILPHKARLDLGRDFRNRTEKNGQSSQ